jgi:hypothetical protein
MLNALAQKEQDPIKGLLALIELHGKGLNDGARMDGRRVGVQGWAEALRNPRIHASIIAGLEMVRDAIVRLVERGQRTGQIRPEIEPEAVARTLIAAFQGLVLQVTLGETVDLPACGRIMRDMIGALLTPAGRASYNSLTFLGDN